MSTKRPRPASLAIWGLLGAFAVLQAVAWTTGGPPRLPWGMAQVAIGWVIMLILAAAATRGIERLAAELSASADAHRAIRTEVEQLQMHNAMLEVLARTVNVPLAFHSIAERIARIVPCDRVGLALLNDNSDEFQTYTARLNDEEPRAQPRPEVVFKMDGTAIGAVVRSRASLIVDDIAIGSSEFLDMNITHSSGFVSALVIPLVSNERAVGTLNVVSRRPRAFSQAHVNALLPVTEILAMAHVAQQLQVTATKHRTMEKMTNLTQAVATEISSAVQTVISRCHSIDRANPDPRLHRDLDTIARQAQRISALLDRMRSASHRRPAPVEEHAGVQ